MTNTKHTPGPWQIVSHSTAGQVAIATQGPMPSVYCIGKDKEANAHLIAAAPELLDALEHAVFELEEKTGVYTGDFQALIKKAKGEA